jgi:hypothetical protein
MADRCHPGGATSTDRLNILPPVAIANRALVRSLAHAGLQAPTTLCTGNDAAPSAFAERTGSVG